MATIFRPDISTAVACHLGHQRAFENCFLIDTAYKGSVPKHLGVKDWRLIAISEHGIRLLHNHKLPELPSLALQERYMLFPRRRPNALCGMVSLFEGCPKYWDTGKVKITKNADGIPIESKIVQNHSSKGVFDLSAQMTRQLVWALPQMKITRTSVRKKKVRITSMGRGI